MRTNSLDLVLASLMLSGLVGRGLAQSQGGGVELVELDKLTASDAHEADRFGWTIALSGPRLLVGAIGNDPHGVVSGAAYVYLRNGSQWSEEQVLIPADGGPLHLFGDSVALEGDLALIGAPNAHGVVDLSGAAYFWQRSGSSWSIAQKIFAADGAADARYGKAVALEGTRAVVGSHWESSAGTATGAVYVYSSNAGTWSEEQKLLASDPQDNDEFGRAVALSGDRIAVGAPYADRHGMADTGVVYVFVHGALGWVEEARLYSSHAEPSALFGYSLALEGDRLVVGAPQCGTCLTQGWATVFRRGAAGWEEEQLLVPTDGHDFDRYGHSLAIEGDTIVVGAPYNNEATVSAGAFYVWRHCGDRWRTEAKGMAHDAFDFDEFAFSVALEGDTIAAGSWRDDDFGSFSGSAYTYSWEDVASVQPYCFGDAPNCPCGNGGGTGAGCANSTGIGAKLEPAGGTTSVAADDLLLQASGLPPSASYILFYGGGQSHLAFGDGLLCAAVRGTRIWRLAAGSADAGGYALFGPGMVGYSQSHFPDYGELQACRSFYFQLWYQDQGGPCGSGVNLSNALAVRFVP